jgi:hypothetical protein
MSVEEAQEVAITIEKEPFVSIVDNGNIAH